jgi:hypothetical protein
VRSARVSLFRFLDGTPSIGVQRQNCQATTEGHSRTLAQPSSVTLTYAPQPASNHWADVQCLAVGLQ